jgi:hypothetical protein
MPVVASQAGLVGSKLQSWSPWQGPQVLSGWQPGAVAGQSLLVRQPTQVLVPELQRGVGELQSVSARQPTQVSVLGSHTGMAVGQRLSAGVHCTHTLVPLIVVQTGVAEGQSWSVRQTGLHVPLVQTGVATGQSALLRHCTQVSVEVSQSGVLVPWQAVLLPAVHCVH